MMNEQTNIDANLLPPWAGPAILLVDLDAFFASVEQLDHPGWRGKPVIVGGHAEARGVVATCSYEARAYGVRSAMPAKTARELCPDAIWSHGNFARYREVSHTIMDIIHAETPHVQQVSIDEAFADISPTKTNTEHPVCIAARIQTRVAELGVTCSIGLGTTKSVAKIASEMDKPSGLTVVYPGSEASFLAPLPVRALSGIGAQAERALLKLGIRTLHDLVHADKTLLKPIFGKNTDMMCARAAGNDISPVEKPEGTKSVSHAITFAHDLTERADIEAALATLAVNVGRRMRAKHLMGTTLTIRIRYDNLAYKSH